MNPLKELDRLGQSIWLDYIRRDLIRGGGLQRLAEEDRLEGVTSNPAIFEKAIGDTDLYQDDIARLAHKGYDAKAIYEALAVGDVQEAADVLRPVYDQSGGKDGYVSLEVNPHLAHDSEGTIAEARRLWAALNRPNVFIKVPATCAGLTAIRALIALGINVNVTLLFGLPRYREVAQAYLAGIGQRLAQNLPVKDVASVASFFLSRIDALIDPMLEKAAAQGGEKAEVARRLLGQAAIASAKGAYQIFKEIFHGPDFEPFAARGAMPQRVLWASTSTKNPAYNDVKYVEPLIAPETINTMPLETLAAYRDHGRPAVRIEEHRDEAARALAELASVGIDIDRATARLEEEGVDKFNQPFDKLLSRLTKATEMRKAA